MSIILIVLIIVIFVVVFSLPKQGSQASNRVEDSKDSSWQLPNPDSRETITPSAKQATVKKTQVRWDASRKGAMPEEFEAQLKDLIKRDKKILAVKLIRAETGCSLQDALEHYEEFRSLHRDVSLPEAESSQLASEEASEPMAEIHRLMGKGQKIMAIKYVRGITGWDLKTAKEYIDDYPNIPPI